ncbi:hypothetical protein [Rhodoferax saidenbachensis]|uniref:Uncharacterized protein n=1 Tax=Rhodoferax saidenbachensis TaxID=1484693 RepID=A0A1P8K923_9BURK|nr:hypothetical protein [Rhodoferax saidenbachensis]APW42513.1 hypothetical protein RS694_08195 [Rhodoferax saidenbachensis]
MNLALFAHSGVFLPLQGLLRWIGTPARPLPHAIANPQRTATHASAVTKIAPKLVAACAIPARAIAPIHAHRKPLRVVRVLEAGQTRASVGRMVISGRMADVCAELDRLAASEATCH